MIKHIVMWQVNAVDGGSKEETARVIKAGIDGLQGEIPGLLRIEGGVDFNRSEMAYDVVLYSEFESRAALDAYQTHPAHEKFGLLMRAGRSGPRVVVDYEI